MEKVNRILYLLLNRYICMLSVYLINIASNRNSMDGLTLMMEWKRKNQISSAHTRENPYPDISGEIMNQPLRENKS